MRETNIFGYTQPKSAECGLFSVCEWAGTKENGGRCHRCSKNFNLKEDK